MFLLLICLLLVAWLLTKPFYWKHRGVPSTLPLPLFGSTLPLAYLSNKQYFDSIYYRFPNAPYVGMYILTKPTLLLRDPQVILEVLEEEAKSFSSHGAHVNGKIDLISKSIFHVDGAEWKSARTKLSPVFSPAKVKAMVNVSKKSFAKLLDEVGSNVGKEMDAYRTAMFLTVDVTAASLFGLETAIFEERQESDFYMAARDLNTTASLIKIMIGLVSPKLYDFLGLLNFSARANAFIINMIEQSMKSSERNQRKSRNMMDTLLESMSSDEKVYDLGFIRSQCALMFNGGVETTANTLAFTLYELANNMELQRQLRIKLGTEERQTVIKEVITETLRKYPVFGLITRKCTERCRLSTGLEVEPGTLILVPVHSVQTDPKYFPDPEKYVPGREIQKGTYLGFGAGPRICLGRRMAHAVLEEALTKLLQKYEFTPGSKPKEFSPKTFLTTPKNGLWIRVHKLDD